MGWRFRKSFKIAPGVKFNLNKNSHSFTFGGKGAHYTVNSKGKRTTTVGIPGTGLYYTESNTKHKDGGNTMHKNNSNNGSIGCLGWICLLVLFGLIINLYSYCWILAIPTLIYFLASKKFRQNRIRNSIICGGVLITSLLVFIWLNAPKPLESIYIDWGNEKFYMGETTEVKITGHPSEAKIESLELSLNDIATLNYSDNKAIVTFNKAGEASLFFTANKEVKSDTTRITVVDKEAEEAELKEQERLAAEKAEAERLAEEKAEAERLAAEQATAEQERLAAEQAAAEQQEPMVWISQTGSKYHSNNSCGQMNPETSYQMPLSEAQNMGYEPCKRCH